MTQLVPLRMPSRTLVLDLQCTCIKGKTDIFVKGQKYHVTSLYQHEDGTFMVTVKDMHGLTIQAFANRFAVLNGYV